MTQKKYIKHRKLLGVILIVSMVLTGNLFSWRNSVIVQAVNETSDSDLDENPSYTSLKNPRISDDVTTWDCIYFGNYWQYDTNEDGIANTYDEKEPIKWRVLSIEGEDAFLMADQNLDGQEYDTTGNSDVTWETCTLREWLNSTFINDAFSISEQSAIKNTEVVNKNNSYYGTSGGNDTTDQVYLLSIDEAIDSKYGFSTSRFESSENRVAMTTQYAVIMHTNIWWYVDGKGAWWLRSPGKSGDYASFVHELGDLAQDGVYIGSECAVRPVLHVDLSSTKDWSHAGTVASDGTVKPVEEPTMPPATPTSTPTESPATMPTGTPVVNLSYTNLSNPRITGGVITDGVTTWDCIYFGNYLQNDTNQDGIVNKYDEKEPIKWRVLSIEGEDAFLMADQGLDGQMYDENENSNVTWETCTLRKWLNNTFINDAFSTSEQSAIKKTNVVNNDNSYYETSGGNDTTDQVYLLSIDEARDPKYGFSQVFIGVEDRMGPATDYAVKTRKVPTETVQISIEVPGPNGNTMMPVGLQCVNWWLRSPGRGGNYASFVNAQGALVQAGQEINNSMTAVRPVLHVDLSSTMDWSFAGTVSGKMQTTSPTTPTPAPTLTPTPTITPTKAPIINTSYTKLKNPRILDDVTTWDCIYFGNYWQNDTNGDGKANTYDEKEPIKWRVLSIEGEDAFLMADQILDREQYGPRVPVLWETCSLREWLNDTFINDAFSISEQSAITHTNVVNNDNSYYGTSGGADTIDQVYLLSIDEVVDPKYGFSTSRVELSKDRIATSTQYAKRDQVYEDDYYNDETGWEHRVEVVNGEEYVVNWWLRSPGQSRSGSNYYAAVVLETGAVKQDGIMTRRTRAVRPVLHADLSIITDWSFAGTVASDGTVTEPDEEPTVAPTSTSTPTPALVPTVPPTSTSTPTPALIPTVVPSALPGIPTATPEGTTSVSPSPGNTNPASQIPDVPGTEQSPAPSVNPQSSVNPPEPSAVVGSNDNGTTNIDSGGSALGDDSVLQNEIKSGKIVNISGLQYKVLKSTEKEKTVTLWGITNKKIKKANVPNAIKIQSVSYNVVEISKNAFKNCKNLQTVTIGKNIRIIGSKAFKGCKKIKKITIRSKVLKKIGKGAFAGISKKAKIQFPKGKASQYRKLIKKS